jgi:hypothetical protein
MYDSIEIITSVRYFCEDFGPQLSPWIIVTLTIERTKSILFPLKFKDKPSKCRTLILFGCIVVILASLNSIWVFSERDNCGFIYTRESLNRNLKIQATLNTWILCILPFILIMVCNILVGIQIMRMRKMETATGSRRRNGVLATFTALTIVTGLLHCVSAIPKMFFSIVWYNQLVLGKGYDPLEFDYMFWGDFANTTQYLNNSLNFYVYCLAGREFRKDLKVVLTPCYRNSSTIDI